ncbi:MAG: PHP domain-containing protein [Halioglobus sp.]|nr:PHP domain-containing protein [Halioglobus sp.]
MSCSDSDNSTQGDTQFEGEVRIQISGEVPAGEETYFFLPFEVPEGVDEIEFNHDDLSGENILDWGLDDPVGFRGWGGGKSEAAIVGVDAASPSYVPGPIPAGTWEVVVGKAKVAEQPARYEVEVILRATATLAPQTERRPYESPPGLESTARWYVGDFHSHTVESDGSPTIAELISLAESRGLDFVLMSEHNTVSQLSWFPSYQMTTSVLLLPGMEFTTYAGHANTIGTTEWIDHRTGVRGATIEGAIADAHAQGGLFSINHPLLNVGDLCIGCGWQYDVAPETIDAVEVMGGIFSGVAFWEDLLDRGGRAAALGGSDDHRGGNGEGPLYSPLAMPATRVWAEELSVAGILDGIRSGRTVVQVYGPDGPMIEAGMEGTRRGSTVFADTSVLRASVTAAAGMVLRLWKNGEVMATFDVTGDPFVHEVALEAPASGADRYRYDILDGKSLAALTSYIWLRRAGD